MICSRCHQEHFEITKMCSNCLEKCRIKNKKKYHKNVDKERERDRKRREEDPEKFRERDRKRREEDPEKFRERDRKRDAAPQRKLYKTKKNASLRGIPFEIEDDQAMSLTDQECFYCGIPSTDELRNGIDRLDNTIGYTTDNCVSCCGVCNNMKHCLDVCTFIERCSQISLHNGYEGEICLFWDDIKGHSYNEYKTRAQNKDFKLTKEQYDDLRKGNCSYCGRRCTDTHTNGIDRVDNNIGYVYDNCVSCCGSCNIAKGTMSVDDFIKKCCDISSRDHTIPTMPRCDKIFVRNRPVIT